jgi:hypothetical protein
VLAGCIGTVIGDGRYVSATLQDFLAKKDTQSIASIAQVWFQTLRKKDSLETGLLWKSWSGDLKISSDLQTNTFPFHSAYSAICAAHAYLIYFEIRLKLYLLISFLEKFFH